MTKKIDPTFSKVEPDESKWLYGNQVIDPLDLLNEASTAAHDLADYIRQEAINALDWRSSTEVASLATVLDKLRKNVISPIEKLRVAAPRKPTD